jgi:hypothetical protein
MSRFTDEVDAYVQTQLPASQSFQPVLARHRHLRRRRQVSATCAGVAVVTILAAGGQAIAHYTHHQSRVVPATGVPHTGQISVALYVVGGPVASPYMKDGHIVPAPADLIVTANAGQITRVHLKEGERTVLDLPQGSYQVQDLFCHHTKTITVRTGEPVNVDLRCDIR